MHFQWLVALYVGECFSGGFKIHAKTFRGHNTHEVGL